MQVPDKIVIGFFTAVVAGQSAAIAILWLKVADLTEKLLVLTNSFAAQ